MADAWHHAISGAAKWGGGVLFTLPMVRRVKGVHVRLSPSNVTEQLDAFFGGIIREVDDRLDIALNVDLRQIRVARMHVSLAVEESEQKIEK